MTRYSISQEVTQVEAPRLLTGKGRFTDDITLPRQAYAVFLRSPHAHAEIKSIDTRAAAQMEGVLAVLTGADYAADKLGPVTGLSPAKKRDGSPMFRPPRPALTQDRVRHIGQPVAMVVAETIDRAKDAAEAIVVDYALLPAHVATATANKPGAPSLWEQCADNEALFAEYGDAKAVDAAMARAAHRVRERFPVSRVAASAMEPRAVVAEYDSGREHFTIHACHQRPYVWRTMMTKHLFDIPGHKMTVIAGDVGGSFGMKGGLYCEIPLAAWAARRIGRPVKWTASARRRCSPTIRRETWRSRPSWGWTRTASSSPSASPRPTISAPI
jgi:aerobic carbon-monoxide dehydrogenase large subunit